MSDGRPAGEPGFEVVRSEEVFDGGLIRVRVDHIADAGGRTNTREVVEHPGAVAALVTDERGNVLLVEQWRQAVGRRMVEVPAGKYDLDGESVEQTLHRELAEELGVQGGTVTWLASFCTTPGWSDEVVDLFLVEGVRPIEGAGFEAEWEEAQLEVRAVSPEHAVELATRGGPGDAKTLAALGLYELLRAGRWRPDPAGRPAPDSHQRRAAARPA